MIRTSLVLTATAALVLGGLTAAGPAAAAGESWPVHRQGSVGTDVRTVQSLLRHRHYGDHGDSGLRVDGSFGPATAAAVRTFQRDHRLPVDGIVGAATWSALVVRTAAPSGGEQVLALQDQLRSLGFTVDRTAVFDPRTRSAVIASQRRYGLTADGVVGTATWRALVARSR